VVVRGRRHLGTAELGGCAVSRKVLLVPAEFAAEGYEGGWSEEDGPTFLGEPGMEPPEGDCYQVWQDVGEQTPISPVFATREECAAWVARTHTCSLAAALKFVDDAWAPSFIGTNFGLYSGVQLAAGIEEHLAFIAPADSHPKGTRIRHLEHGVDGTISFRMPAPNHEYYAVVWDRALPNLLAEDPTVDPDKPMEAGCRADGFEVL
jgi:hypothetical protein